MNWLDRTLKLLGGVAVLLTVSFLYYDVIAFQARRPAIASLIAAVHPQDRMPPAMLRRLVMTETRPHLDMVVAGDLVAALHVEPVMRSRLGYQLAGALWMSLVRLHLTDDEKMAIYCSRSYLGRGGFGFQAGAQAFFGRDLATLDVSELALLVVYARWPSRYSRPDYANQAIAARDALLARLNRS